MYITSIQQRVFHFIYLGHGQLSRKLLIFWWIVWDKSFTILKEKLFRRKLWMNDRTNRRFLFKNPALMYDLICSWFLLSYFRFDSKNETGGHDWLLIFWSPDDAPVRQKMLYASTKSTLKQDFGSGQIKEEIHATVPVRVKFFIDLPDKGLSHWKTCLLGTPWVAF